MKLDGTATLQGTPEQVWAVITDPAVLARTIPGCQSLDRNGEDSYSMVVSVGVGAIRGTYAGEVSLADKQHPRSYVMHASGSGGPGSVRATVPISLEAVDGGTLLSYGADAVVAGAVAGVGQRMISGVAKRLAGQFFTAIDAELTGTGTAAPAPGTVDGIAAAAPAGDDAPGVPVQVDGRRAMPGRYRDDAWVPGQARPLLVGAAGGGLLALLGVWVGYLLGRR